MSENLTNESRIEKFKQEIIILYREAYFAKSQYIILMKVYKKILNNQEEKCKYLLSSIFDALEYSVLLKLTKIFDKDESSESITLYTLLHKVQSCSELNNKDEKIKKFTQKELENLDNRKKDINDLKVYRDKNVSHLDKKYPRGLSSIPVENLINFEKIEEYTDLAYNNIKELYEKVLHEVILDDKQFEIIDIEYNYIEKIINNK